jgi:endonuclease/exonuclease/phosphatase family metal-dependent hydrolase
MTYNVRYFGHATRGVASTRSNVDAVARAIASLDPLPELVGLQEVETGSMRALRTTGHWGDGARTQLDLLLERLDVALSAAASPYRYEAFYFPAHRYELLGGANVYTTGLAVLARSDVSVVEHNAHRPHEITHRPREIRLKQTRICAHLGFERGGERIDLFNTHLSLPAFWSREFWTSPFRMGFGPNQVREAHQLMNFVHATRQSDAFVVLGDFNALPGSSVDRFLRDEAGLSDAFRACRPSSDDEARAFSTAGFMHLRMHLDHLYASSALEWVDLDATHSFDDVGLFEGLSDHVPVVARCRAQPTRPSRGPRA